MCVPVQQVVVVKSEAEPSPISFMGALRIPVSAVHLSLQSRMPSINEKLKHVIEISLCLCLQGVVEFSLCLLFAKLVSYTFLFWLPLYITKAGSRNSLTHSNTHFSFGGLLSACQGKDALQIRLTVKCHTP